MCKNLYGTTSGRFLGRGHADLQRFLMGQATGFGELVDCRRWGHMPLVPNLVQIPETNPGFQRELLHPVRALLSYVSFNQVAQPLAHIQQYALTACIKQGKSTLRARIYEFGLM